MKVKSFFRHEGGGMGRKLSKCCFMHGITIGAESPPARAEETKELNADVKKERAFLPPRVREK